MDIAYEQFGERGPLIVLVMGIGAQMLLWPVDLCASLAAAGYRVVRFDHRDIGLSTRLGHLGRPSIARAMLGWAARRPAAPPYTLVDMAGDVADLIAGLGETEAHVVGASMGGMIAQTLAIHRPERVRSLTSLMSSPGRRRDLIGDPRAQLALLGPATLDRDGVLKRHERMLRVFYAGDAVPAREELEALVDAMIARGLSPDGFRRHLAALLAAPDRTRALRGVTAPTLVLHGTADPLVAPRGGAATAAAIPNARLRWLDGMGHGLPRARWPTLVEAITEHCARAESAQPRKLSHSV